MLAVGDVIIAPNDFGRSLVRIVSIMPIANGVALVTEKAGLDDVVESGQLSVAGVLPDPSAFESAGVNGTGSYARYRDPKGLLTLEQHRMDRAYLGPVRRGASENGVSLEQDVALDYAFTWE